MLEVFKKLYIPEKVVEELSAVKIPEKLESIDHQRRKAENIDRYDLDPGESAAIEIAKQENIILLTDDLEARKKAKEEDISVHGSIGVIAVNQKQGNIEKEEAVELMRQLQRKSALFTTDQVIEKAIEKL